MMLLDVAHQLQVPLERYVGVVATLKQDLDATDRLALIDLGPDLLEAQDVSLAVLRSSIEGAELTVCDADVGVVDVSVDDVGDHVLRVLPPPLGISEVPQLQQRRPLVELKVGLELT